MYAYIFPRTKHAGMCSMTAQIEHLSSEVAEVERAYARPYIGQVGEKLCDVIHSAETGLRMLEERNECDLVAGLEYSGPASSVLALFPQIRRLSKRVELARMAFESGSVRGTAMALCGVIGAAEVALRTLAKAYHVDVDACRRNVFVKNDARGYYAGVPRDVGGRLPGFFAMHDLAETGRPAGPHSEVEGVALPASPSLPQREKELSNGPEEETAC